MDNIAFVDEENIQMIHQQDDDYDERYDTPNTSRIDETSFTVLDTTEATSTLKTERKTKAREHGFIIQALGSDRRSRPCRLRSIYDREKFKSR